MKAPVLYKYTTPTTAKIILNSGRLRWSCPTVFNDLAEFQRMPRFKPTVSESHRLLPQALINAARGTLMLDMARLAPIVKRMLDQVTRALRSGVAESQLLGLLSDFERPDADEIIEQQLRDHFGSLESKGTRVLCLTSTFDNDVMWGTYADNHYGCVLGFTAALTDSPFHQVKPITYQEEPPIVGSGLDFLLYGDSPELRRKTIEAVCYTKKTVWSYEQEWRLITSRPRESEATHGDYIFYREELESVTFGARATPDFIESVHTITTRQFPAVALFRMIHRNGELHRVPVA